MEFYSCKKLQLTDTLKIPRAAIQYTNQSQIKCCNITRMKRSEAVDCPSLVEDDFATFSNDLESNKLDDRKAVRHSTFSGTNKPNLTVANLARLNQMHKNTPIKNIQTSIVVNNEITITVDSMKTTNNKPKENDSNSNASSTHFTMVNGFGGSRNKQPMKPVCCCNNITTLITIMTIMFMIIICGVILFAEYPRMMAEIE